MHSRVRTFFRGTRELFASLCAGLALASVSEAATISGRVTGPASPAIQTKSFIGRCLFGQ